jgi:hypothetical protein
MRNLFIVLAKVIGLLQIPTVLDYVYFLVTSISSIGTDHGNSLNQAGVTFLNLFAACLHMALVLGFVWVLLFRTTWIANQVDLPCSEMNWPERNSFLYVGIKLLGIFVLVNTIPNFIHIVLNTKGFESGNILPYFWDRILPISLKLLIGLILVLKTTKIIEWISRYDKPKGVQSAG